METLSNIIKDSLDNYFNTLKYLGYVSSNKVNGLIKNYNYNTKYLEVEGVSNTKTINIGDYVYTSGLGEIFPSGILIGTVADISTDEYDLSKIIDVTPIADFDDINYVAILKRKEIDK